MSDPVVKLHLLARSEMALAQIRAQRALKRAIFFVVAMVFALMGLGLLNFAAFYAINATQGPAIAALVVALINLGITLILIWAARNVRGYENEERLAQEIRVSASHELGQDIEDLKVELSRFAEDVRTIRVGFNTLRSTILGLFEPLFHWIFKKKKSR